MGEMLPDEGLATRHKAVEVAADLEHVNESKVEQATHHENLENQRVQTEWYDIGHNTHTAQGQSRLRTMITAI